MAAPRLLQSTLVPLAPLAVMMLVLPEAHIRSTLMVGAAISVFGALLTAAMIPSTAVKTLARGLGGYDLNKRNPDKPVDPSKHKKVPEALGIVVGIVALICVIFFQVYERYFLDMSVTTGDYNAALHSMCFMMLLGFADDVLDLRWRYKLVLPAVASLPLLMAYGGTTDVVVPSLVVPYVGSAIVNLGPIYYLYMLLIAIFCTNAINIYAGINGLEAGQSFVIAIFVAAHNLIQLREADASYHVFSLVVIIPFIGVTWGLLYHNWFPSRVFVGDTFTYFAGMTFAVVAIQGHFSKTLLLFFMPQILNFLLSFYQICIGPLVGVKCPRHRLPRFHPEDGLLHGVPGHHNLVNFYLVYVSGPLKEEDLCVRLVWLQVASGLVGLFVRYVVAGLFYEEVH